MGAFLMSHTSLELDERAGGWLVVSLHITFITVLDLISSLRFHGCHSDSLKRPKQKVQGMIGPNSRSHALPLPSHPSVQR